MKKESPQIQIGIIQSQSLASKKANLDYARQQIEFLAQKGAQIICLQELFATPYFCYEENTSFFDLAEEIPGTSSQILMHLAAEHEIVLIASLFEKRSRGIYHNTALVIDADGSPLGIYRKSHIPDDPGYYEKYYFTPGDTGYQVFKTRYAKVGVLICWDQWFPEAARITALKGAEILFYPTAIGWEVGQNEQVNEEEMEAWLTIQKSHAIANGIPVVAVNRVGQEAGTQFWGNSFVSNPFGRLIYRAPSDQPVSEVIPIALEDSEHYRRIWPFFRDRRIDTYASLQHRFLEEGFFSQSSKTGTVNDI